jgi:hypothetical protein
MWLSKFVDKPDPIWRSTLGAKELCCEQSLCEKLFWFKSVYSIILLMRNQHPLNEMVAGENRAGSKRKRGSERETERAD